MIGIQGRYPQLAFVPGMVVLNYETNSGWVGPTHLVARIGLERDQEYYHSPLE